MNEFICVELKVMFIMLISLLLMKMWLIRGSLKISIKYFNLQKDVLKVEMERNWVGISFSSWLLGCQEEKESKEGATSLCATRDREGVKVSVPPLHACVTKMGCASQVLGALRLSFLSIYRYLFFLLLQKKGGMTYVATPFRCDNKVPLLLRNVWFE